MGNDDETVTPPAREHDPEVFKKTVEADRSKSERLQETRADQSDD